MNSITIRKDLRGRMGLARDQGPRPTCIAFAMSDIHAATYATWSELSCEYLFYHAKRRENTSPAYGASTKSTRDALEQDGQPAETGWSYLTVLPTNLTFWSPPSDVGDVYRKQSSRPSGGFATVWDLVEADIPVMVVMTISDAFYLMSGGDVVESIESVDPVRRHAVIATATGERAGTRYLLARNSWGSSWGEGGYAWLAEPYLSPRILTMITIN